MAYLGAANLALRFSRLFRIVVPIATKTPTIKTHPTACPISSGAAAGARIIKNTIIPANSSSKNQATIFAGLVMSDLPGGVRRIRIRKRIPVTRAIGPIRRESIF
jgi:hypothetical protein